MLSRNLHLHQLKDPLSPGHYFTNYLVNLDHSFSVIALSETWLKDNNQQLCNIDGYSSEHVVRESRIGGGVSLFINNDIEYTLLKNVCITDSNMESLFIEIDNKSINKKNNAIVGVLYRPSDTDIKKFNDHLAHILTQIKGKSKSVYLLGDYNINLLSYETHTETHEFMDMLCSFSFVPNITKPTRITTHSATLIDNILCNNMTSNNNIFAGLLYTDISEHFKVTIDINLNSTIPAS